MLKNILNLKGVYTLNKTQQSSINGGIRLLCDSDNDCFGGRVCSPGGHCITPQCTSNSQCSPTQVCIDYYCHEC